jgi:glycosyltransferase involved in cell wall biosynthesis
MKASVIIRVKNEEKWLGEVLLKLEKQTEKDFEVILVDDNSTDDTVAIFNNSNLKHKKVINIELGKFNYPYAANLGTQHAKGEYVFYLSGHSVPKSNAFIESGIKHLEKKDVAGVHGLCAALPDAGIVEKIFYFFIFLFKDVKVHKKIGMGALGLTNAGIKMSLWKEYNFNEKDFIGGGEDTEWAHHFFNKGYKIVLEPEMHVMHSHGIGLLKFIKQYIHWFKVATKAKKYNNKYSFDN